MVSKARGIIRKAQRKAQNIAVTYLPASIVGGWVPRRIFPELVVTNASAINKKVPTAKRRDVPNKFIIRNFEWGVTEFVQDANLHPTIKDLFLHGKHYTETEQWEVMINAVDNYVAGKITNPAGHGAYWCRSRKDVDRYFEILRECYESIKSNGYKTQRQLLEERGMLHQGGVVRNLGDEIEVLIDDSGDLVFSGARANHRFSIAQLLGIQDLPVVLGGIDATYLKKLSMNDKLSYRKIFDECVAYHPQLACFE